MAINSIILRNFKGFKEVRLDMKPLTVLLGPNSAGKSCFGQALVALSKSHQRANKSPLNLLFEEGSSVDLGNYSDLIHTGSEGELVKIQLGLNAGTICFGFGAGNSITKIKELDVVSIEIGNENIPQEYNVSAHNIMSNTSMSTHIEIPTSYFRTNDLVETSFHRETLENWTIEFKNQAEPEQYELIFRGINLSRVLRLTGTAIDPKFKKVLFEDSANLLEKLVYLRPDRMAPRRKEYEFNSSAGPEIDDWGKGVTWFIHEYGDNKVNNVWLPEVKSEGKIDQQTIKAFKQTNREETTLRTLLSKWLVRLGLAASFETQFVDGGRAIQAQARLLGQQSARPLTDFGFGVSQILPVLVKGLTLEENGILVVEQPEAQLHPKPQEGLADFFCSMVKGNKSVLVETHSEDFFHKLRLLAAIDDELADKIAVYFIDEPKNGQCCVPEPISLKEGNELKWPKGFLPDGMRAEMAIRDARKLKRSIK